MTISRGVQASWWVKERGWRLALLNMRLGIHFDKYYWTVTYDINLHHKPLFSQSRSHSIPIYLYLPQKVRSISFFQSSLYKLSKWSIFYFYSAILFYLAHLQAKVRSNSNPSQFTVTRLLFRHAYVAGPLYAPTSYPIISSKARICHGMVHQMNSFCHDRWLRPWWCYYWW